MKMIKTAAEAIAALKARGAILRLWQRMTAVSTLTTFPAQIYQPSVDFNLALFPGFIRQDVDLTAF